MFAQCLGDRGLARSGLLRSQIPSALRLEERQLAVYYSGTWVLPLFLTGKGANVASLAGALLAAAGEGLGAVELTQLHPTVTIVACQNTWTGTLISAAEYREGVERAFRKARGTEDALVGLSKDLRQEVEKDFERPMGYVHLRDASVHAASGEPMPGCSVWSRIPADSVQGFSFGSSTDTDDAPATG
jgi:hypothetical protein